MLEQLSKEFGKVPMGIFKLSIDGLAVKIADGKYYTYNPVNKELVEVSGGFFDLSDNIFVMPSTEVEVGDYIIHQRKIYYITKTGNVIKGIDFDTATEVVLVPKSNVFGMTYFTKVVTPFGTNNILGEDFTKNPIAIQMLMGKGKNADFSKIMLIQSLTKGDNEGLFKNPMIMASLMKEDEGLEGIFKMQMYQQFLTKKKPEQAHYSPNVNTSEAEEN